VEGVWLPRRVLALPLLVALAASSGCVIFRRELALPGGHDAAVMLLSSALGEPLDGIARHPWFAGRKAGSDQWERWEVGGGSGGDPFADQAGGGGDVRLHAVWRGAEAVRGIACLEREAPRWIDELHYLAWPGPNSNTFADVMMRRCGLHASLPATSIGKDYRGIFGASWTSEGTGFQIETPLLGVRIGFLEGIEIHVLAIALGIDFWPPALIVPIGPGRLGFDDR
jgi:hypothetical protein